MPTKSLKTLLGERLSGERRVAVLGIGSELRADDGAGMLVIEMLDKPPVSKICSSKLRAFAGATAPENLTGEIRRFKPSHVVMVDTAEMGEKPGTILLLKPELLGGRATFSTHTMPAEILSNYFRKSIKCSITVIGIQPKSIEFGRSMSKSVRGAAKEVADAIKGAVCDIQKVR